MIGNITQISAESAGIPRSTATGNHNDYGYSPRLGRSSATKNRNKSDVSISSRNRSSDSDCHISSSESQHNNHQVGNGKRKTKNESVRSLNYNNSGVHKGLKQVKDMALSAVMVSSGGGVMGIGRGPSKRNLADSDCELELGSTWQSADSVVPRSTSTSPVSQCVCDKLKSKETLTINVGGQVFETYKSTLKRLGSCKLAKDREMMKYYREEKGDYFFDRDPYAFNIILNYLRYGDLHLPTNLCGPALMREFHFWGVDEQDIERCCFQPYNTWKTQTKSLEKLEYDRKQSTTQTDLAHDRNSKHVWRRCRATVWPFLQDPNSSRAAKIYAWISIIFVFMSIFSFCAETHPFFQVSPTDVHDLRRLYEIFTLEHSNILTDSHKNGDNMKTQNQDTPTVLNNLTAVNTSDVTNGTRLDATEVEAADEIRLQHPALLIIDLMCVFFFTLEFLTRLIFCPKKIRFCTSLQNIIDFVAIVPDYVEFILLALSPNISEGLPFVDFIFILRMLRLCRIFRLIRHVPGLWILLYTLKASFNELLLMFVFLLIGMVMFASLLHFIEADGKFSNIPVGFWWAVVTMTTVGYGDMYPVTGLGYIIGSLCAISGLLMIAFTVPIIVSNFILYYTHVQYGISDKDIGGSRIFDVSDEFETCSFHTTVTETSEVQKMQGLRKQKMSFKSNKTEKKKLGKRDSSESYLSQNVFMFDDTSQEDTEIDTSPRTDGHQKV